MRPWKLKQSRKPCACKRRISKKRTPPSLRSGRRSSSDLECAGRAKRRRRFGFVQMTTPPRISWPHAPLHQLSTRGRYIVTAGTYHKAHHFRERKRLDVLHRGLLSVAQEFGWRLEA